MAKKPVARSEDFKTPECRVSFAQNLFKARSMEEGKPPKYGATLIFPDSARPMLEKIVAKLIVDEWGEKGLQRAKDGLIKSPFLSGTGKEARNKETGELKPGMGEGLFFIRVQANEDHPPVVRYKSAMIAATPAEVYSGCYGFAVLNAFPWNHPTNGDGISFGIKYFQKLRDGDSLGGDGGSVDPEKWHEKIEDAGDAPASTKEGAGAGGLFG